MYVESNTSINEIKARISELQNELNLEHSRLTKADRVGLRQEIEYLESFIPVEYW